MGEKDYFLLTNKRQESDEKLCRLAQEGSSSAEEELIHKYYRLVRICARPWFLAGGDSEDLIQEGMLGLLRAVRKYQPERDASFHTFAEICIRNRLRSAIRAASGGKHTPLNDSISFETPLLEEGYSSQIPVEENPEDAFIQREEWKDRLHQLQSQLSKFERLVLSYYLEGFSCVEIAQKVSRTPKSVDNAVQRIRKKLAKQIQKGVSSES